jgi:hypothetical protein
MRFFKHIALKPAWNMRAGGGAGRTGRLPHPAFVDADDDLSHPQLHPIPQGQSRLRGAALANQAARLLQVQTKVQASSAI